MGDQTRSDMDMAQSARDQASVAIHSKGSRCELAIIANPPDAGLSSEWQWEPDGKCCDRRKQRELGKYDSR